ncbi:MAG: DUF4271 domain-containing protein [Rikenellaceae bacterium]
MNIASAADSLQMAIADSLHRVHVADSLHRVHVADSIAQARLEGRIHIFGEGSTLCDSVAPRVGEAMAGVESLVTNQIYIILAVAFALLYLLWLPHIVRGGVIKWSQINNRHRKDEDNSRGWLGHQRLGQTIVTWSLWIALLLMAAVRGAAQLWDSQAVFSGKEWIAMGGVIVVMTFLYGWGVLRLSGYLTLQNEFVEKILTMRKQLSIMAILFISPLCIISGLTNYEEGVWILQLTSAVVVVFLLIYIRQSFLLFIRQNISILHWILYLCGVELLPLTFLWAMATRQMLL